jgi:hypothetical protein
MNKFLRKNNKKLLAIIGVFLMVAFAAQTRYGSGGGSRGTAVIGHVGDEPVIESELESARQQWSLLRQALVIEDPQQPGQYASFLGTRFAPAEAIEQDPKLYLLLLKEADRMGTGVSDQEVSDFLNNPQIDIQMPNGSIARYDQMQSVDPDYAADVRQATAGFLRVAQASNRAMDLWKFSRPLKNFALAEDHQNIAVRLVDIDAKKLEAKVPAPTTQDLQHQFEQFADVPSSGSGSEKDPLGFGYQIPDAVRLQTIAVSRDQLKQAIKKSKSDYDWKVLEWSYYLKHQSDFPATQPAAPPATAMMTLPTTHPAPTTKPFEEVRADILDKVMAPDVDDLNDRVQKSIVSIWTNDWKTYHAAHPQTQPTTAAGQNDAEGNSSLGVPYGSYDYLKALAAKVQKDFDVLPETRDCNKPLSMADLSKLPGIGQSHIAAAATDSATSFADAAMNPSLDLLAPSGPLQDTDSTNYLFRVTQRIAAHAPASMAEVADAVHSDWVKAQAYQLAQKKAEALKGTAAKAGLPSAAAAAGLPVVTTPPFSAGLAQGAEPIPDVPLAGDDVKTFKEKCQSVLEAAAKHEPPVAVVLAPNQSKVLVIELSDVTPDWPKGEKYVAEAQVTRELMSEFARPLQEQWFTLPSVEARLGYTDAQKNKDAG